MMVNGLITISIVISRRSFCLLLVESIYLANIQMITSDIFAFYLLYPNSHIVQRTQGKSKQTLVKGNTWGNAVARWIE